MSRTFSPSRVSTVPTPSARVASSASSTVSPGMKRDTAPLTKGHRVACSRSQRLSDPARRALRTTPTASSPLFLAGDVPDHGPLAVGCSDLSHVGDLARVLLGKRVAELHLLDLVVAPRPGYF